jgi:hypothetical protein
MGSVGAEHRAVGTRDRAIIRNGNIIDSFAADQRSRTEAAPGAHRAAEAAAGQARGAGPCTYARRSRAASSGYPGGCQ